jgi:hypothetical protein
LGTLRAEAGSFEAEAGACLEVLEAEAGSLEALEAEAGTRFAPFTALLTLYMLLLFSSLSSVLEFEFLLQGVFPGVLLPLLPILPILPTLPTLPTFLPYCPELSKPVSAPFFSPKRSGNSCGSSMIL